MKLKIVVLTLLVVAFALPGLSHAQSTTTPLVLLANQDLWVYDGTNLTNITNDGNIMEAALSPDGTRMAYIAWSPISVEATERTGGIGGGPLPADVKVIDLTTFEITTVAIQPADASFFVDGVDDTAILRGGPSWSPDGTRLAWGELHYPSYAPDMNRIVVFDFNQGDTTVLVTNLPEQGGVPMPVSPQWGNAGIAVASYEYDQTAAVFFTRILVYNDQDGSLISDTRTTENSDWQFSDFVWVNDSSRDWILLRYTKFSNPYGELLDPLTGTLTPALAAPQMRSLRMPNSALVTFTYHWDAEWPDFYSWVITYPDGRQIESPNRVSAIQRVALAPDAVMLAQMTTDGQIMIMNFDGQMTEGPVLEDAFANVYWGPTVWSISMPAACGTALPPRLVIGNYGALDANTTPNNVRSEAATGDVIGQLQPNDDFIVVAGPVCADGMYWWQVDNGSGLVGWTAEGSSTEYWLQPING